MLFTLRKLIKENEAFSRSIFVINGNNNNHHVVFSHAVNCNGNLYFLGREVTHNPSNTGRNLLWVNHEPIFVNLKGDTVSLSPLFILYPSSMNLNIKHLLPPEEETILRIKAIDLLNSMKPQDYCNILFMRSTLAGGYTKNMITMPVHKVQKFTVLKENFTLSTFEDLKKNPEIITSLNIFSSEWFPEPSK